MAEYVLKVAGLNPETFIMTWFDPELPKGSFLEITAPMSEAELRAELGKLGAGEVEVDRIIRNARENSC